MDELDLDAIEARANAATPGPPWRWAVSDDRRWVDVTARGHDRVIATTYDDDLAAFIAHARADVPDLVVEVRRLREDNARKATWLVAAGRAREQVNTLHDRAIAERDDARAEVGSLREELERQEAGRQIERNMLWAAMEEIRELMESR